MEYKIFGCKTNKYFTDKWAESPLLAGKEGVFISSCVVTDKAKSKWVRFAKQKLKTLGEGEKIYISGCGSLKNGEIDQDFYTIYPEMLPYKDKIELLGEDPEDAGITPRSSTTPLVRGADGTDLIAPLTRGGRRGVK